MLLTGLPQSQEKQKKDKNQEKLGFMTKSQEFDINMLLILSSLKTAFCQ